ncbi:MAG: TIM barrel protein [Synergistetes bacterium]|nr:TIM barrel protein [Synergistota bacterium]
MDVSIYRYMKVGIVHFMAYPDVSNGEGPILETLREVATDEFFNAIEVSWIKDDKVRKHARELLEESHITVSYCANPRILSKNLDLNSFDEGRRKEAISEVISAIDEAYELGAASFTILSGADPGDRLREDAKALLVDSLIQICGYAKRNGSIIVNLEVFDRNIDKKRLIGLAKDARDIAEKVSEEFGNFGLLVDLSHLPLLGETPTQAVIPVRKYVKGAHLGNCILRDTKHPAYGDKHPPFGIKGGENDVEEVMAFLRVLMDINFLNPEEPPIVSFEIKPLTTGRTDIVIANAKRVLMEAWSRLRV